MRRIRRSGGGARLTSVVGRCLPQTSYGQHYCRRQKRTVMIIVSVVWVMCCYWIILCWMDVIPHLSLFSFNNNSSSESRKRHDHQCYYSGNREFVTVERVFHPEVIDSVIHHFNKMNIPLLKPSEVCKPERALRKLIVRNSNNNNNDDNNKDIIIDHHNTDDDDSIILNLLTEIQAKLIYFPRIPKTSSTAVMNRFAQYLHYSLMQELDQLVHRLLEWDNEMSEDSHNNHTTMMNQKKMRQKRKMQITLHVHRALKSFYYTLFMDHSYLFMPLSMQIFGGSKQSPFLIHLPHFGTVSKINDYREMYDDYRDIRDRRMQFRYDYLSSLIGKQNFRKHESEMIDLMRSQFVKMNNDHHNNNHEDNDDNDNHHHRLSNSDLSIVNQDPLNILEIMTLFRICLIKELSLMNYSISSSISQTNIVPIQMSFLISGHYPLISSDVEWIRQLPIKLNDLLSLSSSSSLLNPNHRGQRLPSFSSSFSSTKIFVFIRNPLDRLLSQFNYLRVTNHPDRPFNNERSMLILKMTGFRTFDECVKEMTIEGHNPCGLSINYLNSWMKGLLIQESDHYNNHYNSNNMNDDEQSVQLEMGVLSEKILSDLDFIGFTEYFDESIKRICLMLWSQNEEGKHNNNDNNNNGDSERSPLYCSKKYRDRNNPSQYNYRELNNIINEPRSDGSQKTVQSVLSSENFSKLTELNQKDLILFNSLIRHFLSH